MSLKINPGNKLRERAKSNLPHFIIRIKLNLLLLLLIVNEAHIKTQSQ